LFFQNVTLEELFGEMFATGLGVVNTGDDELSEVVFVVENYSRGSLL